MASVPSQGDRLEAKVELNLFKDGACTNAWPPMLPGPGALRESTQYPAVRKKGEEVGAFTGSSTEVGFEVDCVFKWFMAVQPANPFKKWKNVEMLKPLKAWVKRNEVTGLWDKTSPDSPLNNPANDPKPPEVEEDNTNLYLIAALGAAIAFKFVVPRFQK